MKTSRYSLAVGVFGTALVVLVVAMRDRLDARRIAPATAIDQPPSLPPISTGERPVAHVAAPLAIREASTDNDTDVELSLADPRWNEYNWERNFGDYSIRSSSTEEDGRRLFQITRRGQVVFSAGDYLFAVEEQPDFDDPSYRRLPPIGADITGDGQPKLVVESFSGGNHCCHTYYVFSIGDEFRLVTKLGGPGTFADLDHDGIWEFRTFDDTYVRLPGVSMAARPIPEVTLRYVNGQYVVATDLMRAPAPPTEALNRQAEEFRNQYQKLWTDTGKLQGDDLSVLWTQMLDLTYTGHETLARDLFDKSWPEGVPGRGRALHQFAKVVSRSEYWQQLAAAPEPPS